MAKKIYSEPEKKEVKETKGVKLWHERVNLAKKAKEAWIQDSGASRFVNGYKNKFDLTLFKTRDGKNVKTPPTGEIFAYVQADIASTYNRDPYITVNAKAGSTKGAKIWETWLNYDWRELQTKEELELEIIDKDLVGSAWHKVGMAIETEGTGDQTKIASEKLYSMRVDWKDIFWNVGAKRPPKDCEWMAQRIVRPLEDIKAKYPNARGMEGSPHPDVNEKDYKSSLYKDDIKVGIMYEIWDARSKQIYLIAEGLPERFLEDPKPWPDYLDEFPFLQYWDFWNPDSAYPMSAIAPWEAQIMEEMVLLAQSINHVKRFNRQVFANTATFSEDALDKFERGDDGAIIQVNGKVGAEDMRFVDFGQLTPDFYLLMDRLQAMKRNIHGQPEFQRGGVTKTNSRTIGELQLMSQGAKGREERKIDRLETHLENIARHMMAHRKANVDIEQTISITGELPEDVAKALGDNFNPQTMEVTFTPEEIKGEYDVEVRAGSTLPLDKQNRDRIYESVLMALAPVAAKGAISPFLRALIMGMLEGYGIKDLEEAYKLEMKMSEEALKKADAEKDIEADKVAAEAEKRKAQADQIGAETEITRQDAAIGPSGRALAKRLEKPPQRPAGEKE